MKQAQPENQSAEQGSADYRCQQIMFQPRQPDAKCPKRQTPEGPTDDGGEAGAENDGEGVAHVSLSYHGLHLNGGDDP